MIRICLGLLYIQIQHRAGRGTAYQVATVFIGLAVKGNTYVRETHMDDKRTRSFIRRMAGNHAFDMMRRHMSALLVS